MLKNKFGITLIALIITIVILLILVGVVVNFSLGENGIIGKAKIAVDKYKQAEESEQIELAKLGNMIDGNRTISEEDLILLIQSEIKKANDEKNSVVNLVPAGTVISYIAGSNPPAGYLKCDGDTYNISEYPNLAKAILDGFGKYDKWGGNGTTTFAVPNLQGEFLRGYTPDTAASVEGVVTENVGVHQNPTYQINLYTHNGSLQASEFSTTSTSMSVQNIDSYLQSDSTGTQSRIVGSSSTWQVVGNSSHKRFASRPTNTSVLYCIKY